MSESKLQELANELRTVTASLSAAELKMYALANDYAEMERLIISAKADAAALKAQRDSLMDQMRDILDVG